MATKKSKNSGRAWKNERASVNKKNSSRAKSNKYSHSDQRKRKENAEQYWVAGYTRKDGTKVKGHYIRKKVSLLKKIVAPLHRMCGPQRRSWTQHQTHKQRQSLWQPE